MKEPLVDVVMLVHDQAGWADLAIRAVEHHTKNAYRLIIVDMASKEEKTARVLADAHERGHTVIALAENRSFSSGVNVGVGAGSAPFVVVLNDDAVVTEGWDSALLQDANQKDVGLVGARSNYASGAQGDPSFVGEPPWLVFVCVAMRRVIWNTVGPMDEVTFDGFSSEDIDYSWRVKKAGYKLKVSTAFVLHAGSRTLAATAGDAEARGRNDQKYNARLLDKWGKEWVASHSQLIGRGLIATYHAEEHTRVKFMADFVNLKGFGGIPFSYYQMQRTPIAYARNLMADYALDKGYDWIVQLDDDATFPVDLLRRLLSHQKDVVCALAYQRKPPHLTCAFELGDNGLMGNHMEGIEHTGLRRVDISGFHCSIIRTSVIKRLREGLKEQQADGTEKVIVPGTRHYYGGFDNKLGEDFAMCVNLKKLGIPVYVDTELISGHIGSSIIVDEEYKKKFLAGKTP